MIGFVCIINAVKESDETVSQDIKDAAEDARQHVVKRRRAILIENAEDAANGVKKATISAEEAASSCHHHQHYSRKCIIIIRIIIDRGDIDAQKSFRLPSMPSRNPLKPSRRISKMRQRSYS